MFSLIGSRKQGWAIGFTMANMRYIPNLWKPCGAARIYDGKRRRNALKNPRGKRAPLGFTMGKRHGWGQRGKGNWQKAQPGLPNISPSGFHADRRNRDIPIGGAISSIT